MPVIQNMACFAWCYTIGVCMPYRQWRGYWGGQLPPLNIFGGNWGKILGHNISFAISQTFCYNKKYCETFPCMVCISMQHIPTDSVCHCLMNHEHAWLAFHRECSFAAPGLKWMRGYNCDHCIVVGTSELVSGTTQCMELSTTREVLAPPWYH